jgi:hypothetical protein
MPAKEQHMSRTIQSTPYTFFYNERDWPQELVKSFLVRGARHILVGTYGAAKSSFCLDLIGSILSQKPWLGRFEVKAPNPVVFYISQDAGDMDLKAQSFKILRQYFNWENEEDGDLLTARLHIVSGQNITMPEDADDVVAMMRNTIIRYEHMLEPLHETPAPRPVRSFRVARIKPVVQPEDTAPTETAPEATDNTPTEPAVQMEETAPEATEPEDVFDWSKYDILIIYDSARRIHKAEESKSDQMSGVSDALAKIERVAGATTIVLQHENRGGKFKGDTVIMDSAQQAYQLKCPPKKRLNPVRDIAVKVEKNRGLTVKPFLTRFAWTGQETEAENIALSFIREMTTDEADAYAEESKRSGRVSSLVGMTAPVDPILVAARRVWLPGMSQRALGKAMREGGATVGNDRLKKLFDALQTEGKMSLA